MPEAKKPDYSRELLMQETSTVRIRTHLSAREQESGIKGMGEKAGKEHQVMASLATVGVIDEKYGSISPSS